jgi:hypothetical protein
MKKIMVVITIIALCVASFPVAVFGGEPSEVADTVENLTEEVAEVEDGDEVDLPSDDGDESTDPDPIVRSGLIVSRINTKNGEEYVQFFNDSDDDIEFQALQVELFNSNGNSAKKASWTNEVLVKEGFLLFKQGGTKDDSDASWAISNNLITPNGGRIEVVLDGQVIINSCWESRVTNSCLDVITPTDVAEYVSSDCAKNELCAAVLSKTEWGGLINPTPTGDGLDEEPELDLCAYISLNEISFSEPEKFIEIINTFDQTIDLTDCALRRGSVNMILEGELAPGEIKSFDVTNSSLTQSNNSVNIYIYDLILKQNISALTVAYKAKAGASYAWLSVDGVEGWYSTFAMTPGAANIYQQFQTCEVGKHINVATGNCVKDADPPAECAEGQYRNPATGRCKKLDSDKALAECAEGQFRNPLTNRCKKIASDDELSPCAEGWERNPETNRCRKTPIGSEAAYAVGPMSGSPQDRAWLWIGGVGAGLLALMIAWQFRPEIGRLFGKIVSKVKK